MRRREFIALIGGGATAWPFAARGQPAGMPVIGTVYSVSAAQWTDNMAGFRRGLGETGFVDGRNVVIEYRWADGQLDRMPALVADLIGRKVAVILVGGNVAGVRAAMATTQSIPIVFTTATDPVASGLVASLNRPGANVTGATFMADQLIPKQLELLHDVLPAATNIAVLVNPANPATMQDAIQGAKQAAAQLGLKIIVLSASDEPEIDRAIASATDQQAAALVINDAFIVSRLAQIAALGLRHALPVIAPGGSMAATDGVLLTYGADIPDTYRQVGRYVGRILKGDKPTDLPILQPTKFELVINLRTAKKLGLTIPESFLVRADAVIE
jgi:putative tryptophan/tyrosine transport system substrate-binding protein